MYIGWTYEIKNETFTVDKVEIFDLGPEVILSVTIKKAGLFSIKIQYVNQEFCSHLRSMPSKTDSGMF